MAEDTAHLIDVEPVLILGCSGIELMGLAAVSFAGSLFVWLLVLAPFGFWVIAIPMALLTALGTVYFGGRALGKEKEGRPDGYFSRLINSRLGRIGSRLGRIGIGGVISHTGYWGIRR